MQVLHQYEFWNDVVVEHCLLAGSVAGSVGLAIAPRVLSAALHDLVGETLTPDEAEAAFVEAVRAHYAARIVVPRASLDSFHELSPQGIPSSVAFLAATVLAAYRMQTDDDHTGRAYYPRLSALLGCSMAGSYPEGFDPQKYVELWDRLAVWLAARHKRQLVRPTEGARRRYLAYPMAHVPLRQVDIDRLPRFFDAFGYQAQSRAAVDRIAFDLFGRSGPWPHFTEAGRTAVADPERRPLVVKQVAFELEHWDGAREDSQGRRAAPIQVWMEIRQRRARLYLLGRRPSGFPDSMSCGEYAFQSQQDDWYEPLQLNTDDSSVLEEGLTASDTASAGFLLKLHPVGIMPLVPSEEFSGFVSSTALRRNTSCAVLCRETAVAAVGPYLENLCGRMPVLRRDETLPSGWCLYVDVRPSHTTDPPFGLETLAAETDVALAARGGLRVGRRWTWLEGAAPRLQVIGTARDASVRVNGTVTAADNEGFLPSTSIAPVGQHTIEIGNQVRRRVVTIQGFVSPECLDWEWGSDLAAANAVLLPAGAWTLIGAGEGEIAAVSIPSNGGIASPAFLAAWAIRTNSSSGNLVLHLHALLPSMKVNRSAAAGQSRPAAMQRRLWAEAAYQAHVRRPQMACTAQCPPELVQNEWRRHFDTVRTFKRRLKANR